MPSSFDPVRHASRPRAACRPFSTDERGLSLPLAAARPHAPFSYVAPTGAALNNVLESGGDNLSAVRIPK